MTKTVNANAAFRHKQAISDHLRNHSGLKTRGLNLLLQVKDGAQRAALLAGVAHRRHAHPISAPRVC
jgi:hypothetical protein